jgi:prevent-host-death family protein
MGESPDRECTSAAWIGRLMGSDSSVDLGECRLTYGMGREEILATVKKYAGTDLVSAAPCYDAKQGGPSKIEERKRGDTMMTKLPEVIPMSDLQEDTSSVLQRLRESGTPAVITQEGRAAAVLIDIESFRRTESEREILALLARGEQEIAAGLGYDLDEVLAEADALLSQRSA